MTIFGTGYRPSEQRLVARWRRLWPLFRHEFGSLFRTKLGTLGFLCACVPSIISFVVLLVRMGVLRFVEDHGRRGPGRMPTPPPRFNPELVDFYLDPIVSPGWGLVPALILTGLVASRAIAKDRPSNAIELYWTRGVSPLGYFLAKGLGATALMACAMVLVPLGLWLTGVVLAEDWNFAAQTAVFMPRAVLALGLFTFLLGACSVGLSALCASANFATMLWSLLLVGSLAIGNLVGELLGRSRLPGSLSLWDAAATLARAVAGMPHPQGEVGGALTLVLGVAAVLGGMVWRRLRLQEAIG